ncbi:MAG: phage holin family protein [Caulobacteraceae bacterium]|nr:phage holin family protein [Caulobacteraceae bacterium]
MIGFIVRALIAALGLWIAAKIVPGIGYRSLESLLWAALLLGVVNAIVRPILILLTLPFTLVTLGLFLFVINGLMLLLVAVFVHGFHVHGLIAAILGSIVVGLTSWVANWVIGSQGWEVRRR